jgi:hypothetical protein
MEGDERTHEIRWRDVRRTARSIVRCALKARKQTDETGVTRGEKLEKRIGKKDWRRGREEKTGVDIRKPCPDNAASLD